MTANLKSYTVDFEHQRITLRPAVGPEIAVHLTALRQSMRVPAQKHVDKTIDVEKQTKQILEKRQKELERNLPVLKGLDVELAKEEIERIKKLDLKRETARRREQLIAETAGVMAREHLEDLMGIPVPKAYLAHLTA